MDVSAITKKIEENAQQTAQSLLSEAQARVEDLQSACDETLQDRQRDLQEQIKQETATLNQSLRRLHDLDGRKQQLSLRRSVIDEAFEKALDALRNLPAKELGDLLKKQVVANAEGTEQVAVGAINPGFFDAAYLDSLNAALSAAGKPGELHDAKQSVPGVCGLVLLSQGSRSYCTVETLLEGQRESLEGDVSRLLWDETTA